MVGVPLQLLENRPDVKIAEMTLASAYYTTNQARAAFLSGIEYHGDSRLDEWFRHLCRQSGPIYVSSFGFVGPTDLQQW